MDIRNVNPGSNVPADRLRSESNDKVNQVEESSSAENDTEDTSRPTPQDRIEISDAGQMANVDLSLDEVMKLRMARRALHDIPPLSPDRITDIKERVRAGDFNQPKEIRKVARGFVNEMLGVPPEGGQA